MSIHMYHPSNKATQPKLNYSYLLKCINYYAKLINVKMDKIPKKLEIYYRLYMHLADLVCTVSKYSRDKTKTKTKKHAVLNLSKNT